MTAIISNASISLHRGDGTFIFPFAFTFEQFHLELFARSISKKARYCGLTLRDISTAEHSLLLSYVVAPQHAPYALIHDLGEVPFGDIPGPVKQAPGLEIIREAEDAVLKTIATGLGLHWPFPEEVSILDKLVVQIEAPSAFETMPSQWQMLPMDGYEHALAEYHDRLEFLPAPVAQTRFLQRFHELFPHSTTGRPGNMNCWNEQ